MSAAAWTTFLPVLVLLRLFLSSYGQTRFKVTTWHFNIDLWHLRLPRMTWCGSLYSIGVSSLKFVGLPVPKIWRYGWFSVTALSGLVTLTFWPSEWCGMSDVVQTILLHFVCISATFSLSTYGQTCIGLMTWPYYLDLWPLTSSRMSVMRIIVLHPCTKFKVRRSPIRKTCHISVSTLIGLYTLTFDLSNSIWSHPCHGLPSCQFSSWETHDGHQRFILPQHGAWAYK